MRNTAIPLLITLACLPLGCASEAGRMYVGPTRADAELALVEVNSYAQNDNLRWVVTDVSVEGGPSSRKSFRIPAGEHTLQVKWRIYDATEESLVKSLFLPIFDQAKRIDEGVESIPFTATAGRLYRLRWAARPDASAEGEPRDMMLKLFSAGLIPRRVDSDEG